MLHEFNARQRKVRVETCFALLNRHPNEAISRPGNRIPGPHLVNADTGPLDQSYGHKSRACVIYLLILRNEYSEELSTIIEKLALHQPALINRS